MSTYPYVSAQPKTGLLRYFRRPTGGVKGSVFTRTFSTKDWKVVGQKYAPVHAEAKALFAKLASGITLDPAKAQAIAQLLA
jgi:hypothetical protein